MDTPEVVTALPVDKTHTLGAESRLRSMLRRSREWRSSVPFTTSVVALGIAFDSLNYNIVVSVFPFRLEALNYSHVSSLVGWLLFIYSAGLVIYVES